ncbi:MAG: TIGR01777 family oxidoreductase [Anaerolineae bacterium]|jgi:hypothetical protein|nr:TIGR01777 family oxidoreductase [Anaerolineae bacterium]
MRVLITAGTGLIGRALARELAEVGHTVTVSSRNPKGARPFATPVTMIPWDTQSAESLIPAVENTDAIVHLVGEGIGSGLWTASRKRRILQSRVVSGQMLTEAVARAGRKPHIIVQASAVGYYGPHGDERLDETSPAGDDWMARTAAQWEASTAGIEAMALRRVVVRTGLALSAQAGVLPKMMLPFRLFVGGPLGNGRQGFSWIHIADLASAYRFLIEHPEARGAYNATAPNPVVNSALGRALGAVMRRPYWIPAPAFAMRLVLGELSQLLLQGQHVLPQRLTELGFVFRYPDLHAALVDLMRRGQPSELQSLGYTRS